MNDEYEDGYEDAEIARRQAELEALKISALERSKALNVTSYAFLFVGCCCLLLLFSLAWGPKP